MRQVAPANPDGSPGWAVPFGQEFWRSHLAASPPTALGDAVDRVQHALSPLPAGGKVDGRGYRASFAADGARFEDSRLLTRAIDLARSRIPGRAADDREAWFVRGDTAQALLDEDRGVVEHFEAREAGIEWTWLVRTRPEGAVHVSAAVEGLHPQASDGHAITFLDGAGAPRVLVSDATAVDHAGHRWPLALEAEDDGFALTVPAEVVAAAEFPLAIDPVVSSAVALDTAVAIPHQAVLGSVAYGASNGLVAWTDSDTRQLLALRIDGSGQAIDSAPLLLAINVASSPVVAASSDAFLVAWSVSSTSPGSVQFVRVHAADGTLIDTNPMTFLSSYGTVSAASNGTNFYVAAMSSYRVYGQVLPASGSLSIAPVVVSGSLSTYGSPMVGAAGGSYLVTWFDYGYSSPYGYGYALDGARVSSSGTVLDAPPRTLSSRGGYPYGGQIAGDAAHWVVAFNRTTGAYVTFVNTNDASPVSLNPTLVSTNAATTAAGTPSIVLYQGNYVVAWSQTLNPATSSDLYGTRVDANSGALLDPYGFTLFSAPGVQTGPMLAASATGLVATYLDVAGPVTPAMLGVVSGTGGNLSITSPQRLSKGVSSGDAVAVASTATTAVAVWTDNRNRGTTGTDLYAARVELATGTVLDPSGLVISNATTTPGNPAVTTDGTDFFVTWAEGGSLRAARIGGADGQVTSSMIGSYYTLVGTPAITAVPEGLLIVYAGSPYCCSNQLQVTRLKKDLSVIASAWSGCCSSYGYDGNVRVTATANGGAVVVFSDTTPDLYAVRLNPSTYLAKDSVPIAVSRAVGAQRPFALAASGSDALVAWYDTRSSPVAIYGARVDTTNAVAVPFPAGQLLVNDAIGASTLTSMSGGIGLSGDANGYLLSWVDDRAPNGVRAQRFATDLTPLDSAPLLVQGAVVSSSSSTMAGPQQFVVAYTRTDPATLANRPEIRTIGDPPNVAGSDSTLDVLENVATNVPLPPLGTSSFVLVTTPQHGTAAYGASGLVYTPAVDYVGPDTLQWAASNGPLRTSTWTVSITVHAHDVPPTASDLSVTTLEDTPVAVTLKGASSLPRTLTYSVKTGPAHGTLSGTAPALTYAPGADWNGTDAFTYVVNDGHVDSAPATVTVTVTPVNDPPRLAPASFTTPEEVSLGIHLVASDPENDPITWTVSAPPSHGALGGSGPDYVYTPAGGFVGTDSFAVVLSDGMDSAAPVTVSITVTPVNHAPVAQSLTATTSQDSAVALHLEASDRDGDALTYATGAPQHGTLSGSGPDLVYTPAPGFWGSDGFTWTVSDGQLSASAQVTVTVQRVDHPPVASPQQVTTPENQPITITLAATDPEGDALTFQISSPPALGKVQLSGATATYTPGHDATADDTFTFIASDGTLSSAPAVVTVHVTPVNQPPEVQDVTASVPEDGSGPVQLLARDPEGTALTFTIVTPPSHGSLSGTAPNLVYTPAPLYRGPDAFTWRASDGQLDSAVANATITVTPVNHPPQAQDASVTVVQSQPFAITLSATDLDNDPIVFRISRPPLHGVLRGAPPNVVYTSNLGYVGPDSFLFTASDATSTSTPATVTISVASSNHPPVAADQTVSVDEGATADIVLEASDADGNALTFGIVTPPAHGALAGTPPDVRYTPEPGFSGTDAFTFAASDGVAQSAPATVTIDVAHVNQPPVASGGTVSVTRNHPVVLALSATDADGDALTYRIVTPPAHGSLSGEAPAPTYTPEHDFTGRDALVFVANDGQSDSAPATIVLDVEQGSRPPTADDQTVELLEDGSATIHLTGSDPDGATLSFAVLGAPAHGTLTGTAPDLVYTPAHLFEGYDQLTFTVDDGAATSAPGTVTLHVAHVNHPPAAADVQGAVDAGVALNLLLPISDPDGDPIHAELVSEPQHGKASIAGNVLTYTSDPKFVGTEVLSYEAFDHDSHSPAATITIKVRAVGSDEGGGAGGEATGVLAGGCASAGQAGLLALLALCVRRRRK